MFDSDALDLAAHATAAPGPELAATLAAVDPRVLNGHGRVIVMQAWQRLSSWATGGMYDAMALVARSPACVPDSPAELNDSFARGGGVDHTQEHRLGGPSCPCNLTILCRRHHRAKHLGGWWWTRPSPGAASAQSPLGHTYNAPLDLPFDPPGGAQQGPAIECGRFTEPLQAGQCTEPLLDGRSPATVLRTRTAPAHIGQTEAGTPF